MTTSLSSAVPVTTLLSTVSNDWVVKYSSNDWVVKYSSNDWVVKYSSNAVFGPHIFLYIKECLGYVMGYKKLQFMLISWERFLQNRSVNKSRKLTLNWFKHVHIFFQQEL